MLHSCHSQSTAAVCSQLAVSARPYQSANCRHKFMGHRAALTGVAVLLALEAVGDAEEGAVTLGAGVAEVIQALGLDPAEQQQLGEDQGACRGAERT